MNQTIIPATFEVLQKVFCEPKFQRNIRNITKIMDNEKIEAGFCVYKDFFSKKFYVGKIGRGSLDGLSPAIGDDNPPFEEFYKIVDMHAHEKLLTPSSFYGNYEEGQGDLRAWNDLRDDCSTSYEFDNPGINLTCKKVKKDQIKIFAVHPTSKKPLSEILFEDIVPNIYGENECQRRYLADQEVVDRFNKTGVYQADILTLNPKGFSKKDLGKLKQFEYSLNSLKKLI